MFLYFIIYYKNKMADIYGTDDLCEFNTNMVEQQPGSDALTIMFIICFAVGTLILSCMEEFKQNIH